MTDILLSVSSVLYAASWAGFWWHMARVRPTVLQWALRLRPELRARAGTDPDLAPLRARDDFRSLVGESVR